MEYSITVTDKQGNSVRTRSYKLSDQFHSPITDARSLAWMFPECLVAIHVKHAQRPYQWELVEQVQ